MKTTLLALLVTLAPLTAARAAPGPTAEAESLINHGLDLREKGDDEAALRDFQRANELAPSGRAMAQIALAEQALGRWADAEAHLDQALRATGDAWVTRRRKVLASELESIREHLGSVDVIGAPAGAELSVNGKRAGDLPLPRPLRVPAGSAVLELRAPGFFPLTRTVLVTPRGLHREAVEMAPVPREPPRPPPPPAGGPARPDVTAGPPEPRPVAAPATGSWHRPAGYAAAAGAIVGLGAGFAFHLTRESRANEFNDQCTVMDGKPAGAADCAARRDRVDSATTAAIVGYGAAGVLALTSVLLFATAPEPGAAVQAAWSCAPAAAPQAWGVGCRRAF